MGKTHLVMITNHHDVLHVQFYVLCEMRSSQRCAPDYQGSHEISQMVTDFEVYQFAIFECLTQTNHQLRLGHDEHATAREHGA
jgi:hypothetical protein